MYFHIQNHLKKLDTNHKLNFRKIEKEIKECFIIIIIIIIINKRGRQGKAGRISMLVFI